MSESSLKVSETIEMLELLEAPELPEKPIKLAISTIVALSIHRFLLPGGLREAFTDSTSVTPTHEIEGVHPIDELSRIISRGKNKNSSVRVWAAFEFEI